ncbi:hypothetical protein O181_072895 [Austropuccinia psidii MF-1]|uniref:Uncharacterized protein n=1 Tax=Austropuccinia psidii MF-1 TaxID=1389203 RepID=A0A9Q3F9H9_9BASI|nr:hypothetical protein [Austropuccinia psidii MF-1]
MSPVHLMNQPEDREGLSRTRIPGRGHLRNSGGWKNIEGNHTHSSIQQKPQTRGLEEYGSSSSAPPTSQKYFPIEHGQQEVQPSIPLGRTWSKLQEDMSQRDNLQRPYRNHQRLELRQAFQTPIGEGNQDKGESSHYPSYRITAEQDRAYSDSFRLIRSRPNQISYGLTPFRLQHISGQESPFFTIPGSYQEKTRIQGKKQDIFWPKEERVRPNDPEAVGLGERSKQEPEMVVNTSRISSPTNINITPTQTEHNVVTPESNLNSDKLWLKMSQFAVKTQEQLDDLKRLNERFQRNAILKEATIKFIQEGCVQLRKASEETNKRLYQVFEEKQNCKRDRNCLDHDINELFNVDQKMKPQPQGHALDDPYHQENVKQDALLGNKARSLSQYQDGNDMSYSEKEALKKLPEASSCPKFSGTGEYDHMELIDYIDGFFIDVPGIPDYWITARINTEFKCHSSIWYTEMQEIHGRRNWLWWESQIIQKYSNGTWIWQKTILFENDKY